MPIAALEQANALREWLRALRQLNPSLPWPTDRQLDKIPTTRLPPLSSEVHEAVLWEQQAQLDDRAHDNLNVMLRKANTILTWIEPKWSREDRDRFFDEAFRSFGLLDGEITMADAENIVGYEPPARNKSAKRRRKG